MKNILLIGFLFSIGCHGAFFPLPVAAGEGRPEHTSADRMLEFSLLRLKESVQKTAQKNERLSFENDVLRKSIQDLQAMRETLFMKKAELSDKPNSDFPRKETRFTGLVDMDAREKRAQELIAIFQRDIGHLKEEIRIKDDSLSEEGFNSHKKALLQEKEKSSKDLLRAKKEFESVKRRNLKPLRQIEELKKAQKELAREIEELQNKLGRF